ncbi:methyltransferase domain-containing protein [Rhodococcus sp. G-MC3]|uniref:class I SAM-dependent methyltransferase n=1 Tax=Rhodococcus sp. G-MC3 TaxID=3046209 RepID=UPI0024B9F819|nr:methyltransferase domain-containing protein [Rhodococcus sp. G-MC3]MDJ0392666.1 methyltransferase domain-containing protein [Rhodococcus sp. G-MC3]
MMTSSAKQSAMSRALALVDPVRCPRVEATSDGYADTLGGDPPPVRTLAQRLMRTRLYSAGYQIGRPIGLKVAGGAAALSRDEDRGHISRQLCLRPGAVTLDIGCGPGNFTGWFGSQVFPDGLAVGVDASHEMLRRAVADNSGPSVAYLRGDAECLPFADGIADAVSCLAALYLINEPFLAISEIARVLKPGGRIVILTSHAPGGTRTGVRASMMQSVGGVHMFGRDEITDRLHDLGFSDVEQRIGGLAQTIVGTR